MKNTIGNSLGLIAALFLSACEFNKVESPVGHYAPPEESPIEEFASWTDVVPQQTFIGVRVEGGAADEFETFNINDVLSNENLLRRALDTHFPELREVRNLRERIEILIGDKYAGSEEHPALRGLGGVVARAFLRAASAALDSDTGLFNERQRVFHFTYGRILYYEYNNEDSPTAPGSGRLETITYYTRVTVPIGTPDNTGEIISETDAVRWKVDVGKGGFEVVERDDSAPDGPFPDTMEFSDAMKNRVQFLGFEYKLWAEGELITIDEVARKDHGETDYTILPGSAPEYHEGPDNCIDMMFVDPPPPRRGVLRPPLYCLGRCAQPHLVNTGAA